MTIALRTSARNARADQITAQIETGGAGTMYIYATARPGAVGSAPGGAPIATFPLPTPVAPAAVSGVLTFNAIAPINASGGATAIWFRIEDGANNAVLDGDVGATGSGSDLELDNTFIGLGQLMSIDSVVMTEGNA